MSSLDLSTVNWVFVALMAVFAFIASLIGNLIAFRNVFFGAIITGILLAAIYVVWNHYPHPTVPLPIVSSYTTPSGG